MSSRTRSRTSSSSRAAAFAVLTCCSAAAAGAQATASPRAVVEESFADLAAKNWDAVTALASPQFLEQFRAKQLFYAEDDERQRMEKKKNPDSYGLPKCVQKYFESQQGNFSKRFLTNFAGVDNLLQLEILTPAQFFGAWLAGTKNLKPSDEAAGPRIVVPIAHDRR